MYKVRIEPSIGLTASKGKSRTALPFAAKYTDEVGDTGLTTTVKLEAA